jgi:hypothetical protein
MPLTLRAVAELWERLSQRFPQHAGIAGGCACFSSPENGAESYPQKAVNPAAGMSILHVPLFGRLAVPGL